MFYCRNEQITHDVTVMEGFTVKINNSPFLQELPNGAHFEWDEGIESSCYEHSKNTYLLSSCGVLLSKQMKHDTLGSTTHDVKPHVFSTQQVGSG